MLVECKNVVEFDENGDFWAIVQLLKDELQNESFAYNTKPHDAKVNVLQLYILKSICKNCRRSNDIITYYSFVHYISLKTLKIQCYATS